MKNVIGYRQKRFSGAFSASFEPHLMVMGCPQGSSLFSNTLQALFSFSSSGRPHSDFTE